MTTPAPLTPSSPDWGTIVCDFCQRAPVSVAGHVCWNCQSYLEYLYAPRCDCPHDPNVDCRCEPECEEDCPAEYEAYALAADQLLNDGDEVGQGPEGAERSEASP
jgi:hypothetical protein